MSLVSHFSDQLIVMYAGQVSEIGPTRQVFDHPAHPYSRGLLDAFPSIRGPRVELTGIPGSPPDLARPPQGCRFNPRCPQVFDACRVTEPLLYQVGAVQARCLLHANGPAPVLEHREPPREPGRKQRHGERCQSDPNSDASASNASASSPATAPLLETRGLTKHFKIGGNLSRKTLHAVDDVNIIINRQEIVALAGESGSGKSTIARLLARIYKPTSGEILLPGQAIVSDAYTP